MSKIDIEYCSEIDVECVQQMGGDWSIIAAAKVSVDPEEAKRVMLDKDDDGRGLIKYLMRNRHGTPFEHSSMSFYVDAPIFVWREWHRHRIGVSYNEESGRWSQLRPKFYIPSLERPMMTSEHYKPSKPILESMCESMYWDWIKGQKIVYQFLYENYVQSLNKGIAKEVARMILPVGIYSRCWVTFNPRSLMHFLSLRTHDEKAKYVSWPQHEIELAARSCEEALKEYWPITYEAFNEYGRVSP